MILLFPDFDALRLALTSNTVPADVTLAPAAVSFDELGRVYVEPIATLTKTIGKALDRMGVKGSKRHGSDTPIEVTSWVQILPVTRETGTPNLSSQTPVLFELQSADDLPTLVGEMLRLGNDRQGFRWFASPSAPETSCVLLRVVGPTYYTLLRAIDQTAAGTSHSVRAYVERAPRVWVEIGHTHPLAPQIKVADRQLVLIRAPRDWLFLDEAPFQDVYDILQFQLPAARVGWVEAKNPKKMPVPLRLTAGNAADVAELWALRDEPVARLDTFVRDADERLIQRLMFAVATDPAGDPTVILRTRPSKLAPPALPLDGAIGYKPYWKLPNLFVPVGKRLHPTLRREAVRRLLADNPDQVIWLHPDGRGGFTPESVPDAAFRSLEDWVDYVIEADRAPLSAWIDSTRFDFDHFVCKDHGGPKSKPDRGDKEPRSRDEAEGAQGAKAGSPKAPTKGKSAAAPSATAEYLPPPPESRPPNEWKIKLKALEDRFLAVEGSLDAPDRLALWPELAEASAGSGDSTEAAICWLNAIWNTDPASIELLAGWARTEFPDVGMITESEFDRRMKAGTGSVNDHRAVVAGFLWLAAQRPIPPWLVARLPAIQKYLEVHEGALPVRAAWLAAYRLAQLAGADVLGLARARDRALNRLLNDGLSPERDLPSFLRFAGLRDSERIRGVKEKALELHQTVRKWIEGPAKKDDQILRNLPFVDLFFGFAMAKLGEVTPARRLLEEARLQMETVVPTLPANAQNDATVTVAVVRNFLYKAFKYRIEQVIAGKPHTGALPPEVTVDLDDITKSGGSGGVNNPFKMAQYVIARMREQSHLLEPQEKPDPYGEWTKFGDAVKKELSELPQVRDPLKLTDRIRRMLREGSQGKSAAEVRFQVLFECLPLAPRAGEVFTVELIELVPAALSGPIGGSVAEPIESLKKQGELLRRAIFFAGHYDRSDLVQRLVAHFSDLVHRKKDNTRFDLINVVAGQCLRSLRKLGLRDEIDRLLSSFQKEVVQGESLANLRKKHISKPEAWGSVLQTLLNLAAGWMTFGMNDRAMETLDGARAELLGSTGLALPPKNYTDLARTYIGALGQGPSETGLPRMIELFKKMEPKKINNTFTTAPHYSRFHLNLVEEVVLAMVSDEFALGPAGRKWLDDDEYLVRKRIHGDMKRGLDRSGL
jgi:hypothetical protein